MQPPPHKQVTIEYEEEEGGEECKAYKRACNHLLRESLPKGGPAGQTSKSLKCFVFFIIFLICLTVENNKNNKSLHRRLSGQGVWLLWGSCLCMDVALGSGMSGGLARGSLAKGHVTIYLENPYRKGGPTGQPSKSLLFL